MSKVVFSLTIPVMVSITNAFFDLTYYPIQVGKEVRRHNSDDVSHKIIIGS
ncbi:MAG: hypothetical protein M3Q77_09215 [Thermoproteota archaeon]|nr:hypothetical protein [Thermoproteota archaeon]